MGLADFFLWLVMLLFLYGALLSFLAQLSWLRWTRNSVASLPLSRCRSAAQGYVKLFGKQRYVAGKPLHGPLTGKPCTWWHYVIEKRVPGEVRGSAKEWTVIKTATCSSLLKLDDGTGQVLIDPAGVSLYFGPTDCWHGETASPAWPPPTGPVEHKYRYTESRADEGDTLYVAGQLTTHSVTPTSAGIRQVALRMLNRWKQNQPMLRERFDGNRDGAIDPEEWEHARQAAFAEAKAQLRREQELAVGGLSMVSRPADGKPFVISPVAEVEVGQIASAARPTRFWLVLFLSGALWAAWELGR